MKQTFLILVGTPAPGAGVEGWLGSAGAGAEKGDLIAELRSFWKELPSSQGPSLFAHMPAGYTASALFPFLPGASTPVTECVGGQVLAGDTVGSS